MKNTIISLFILLSAITTVKGQHCGWDFTSIIIIDIRDSLTGKIINGLEVVLADSTGKPYTSKWNLENNKNVILYQNTDTLKFGQNLINKPQEFSKVDGPFPFGIGYYMLLVYYNNYPEFNKQGKDKIIIKDVDGDKNLGRFETVRVNFEQKNIASLCTNNYKLWHEEDGVKVVKITVNIKRKQ